MEDNIQQYLTIIVDMVSESFRLKNVIDKMLLKLPMEERSRYQSQCSWYFKKVNKLIKDVAIEVVDLTDKPYNLGMPVTPLNISDFSEKATLYVAQTIEPTIVMNGEILKTGTVMLREEFK